MRKIRKIEIVEIILAVTWMIAYVIDLKQQKII